MASKKSKPSNAPKKQEELLAPKTQQGIDILTSVIERYDLPVPQALSDSQKTAEFPDDLSEVHGDDIARLMGYYTALQNYASYQSVLLATDINILTARVDSMIEEQLHRITGSTVKEKVARARMHPQVREVQQKLEIQQGVYDLIKALFGNYERCFQALSREVTRRQSSHEV